MSSLEDKVIQAGARLWGKPESQVQFELDLAECTAGVFAFVDENDPEAGTMGREVIVYPKPGVDPEVSPEYYVELLQSLLDVIHGAMRRNSVNTSMALLTLN